VDDDDDEKAQACVICLEPFQVGHVVSWLDIPKHVITSFIPNVSNPGYKTNDKMNVLPVTTKRIIQSLTMLVQGSEISRIPVNPPGRKAILGGFA
jgi:hypothetical protein